MQIIPLTGIHNRQAFDSGPEELNDWLQKVARQHQEKGLSKTYVATRDAQSETIHGYYALKVAELESKSLPDVWRKKLPRRIPGVRLGRLALNLQYQGKGLGELLLIDALARARLIYNEVRGIGVFVDAIDTKAAGYYLRFGFLPCPDNPLLLFLPANG